MQTITVIFLLALAVFLSVQYWLLVRQARSVASNRGAVPGVFAERISLEAHQKAADYTLAKLTVTKIEIAYSALILLLWTLGGGLNWLDSLWRSLALTPLYTGLLVIFSFMLISTLIDLPFTLYRTFVVEERFGFNRITGKQFIVDMLLTALLSVLIAGPLLALILWFMQDASPYWWIYVSVAVIAFSLFISWVFPTFIAPLFNKFTPLQDEKLRQRIEQLLSRCGFASSGIFVMDGSKRSSHGNAYFTGLGKNKRIVFFDTLLETLDEEEVESVLAHELGHFKRHHVRKGLLLNAVLTFCGMGLLAWVMKLQSFYLGLGVNQSSIYMALLLFMIIAPLFSIYLQPLLAGISRKHEFEADDFAASQSQPQSLIRALVKLYRDNASTLTPDPLYSAFHDSHPPAPVRIAHLSTKLGS